MPQNFVDSEIMRNFAPSKVESYAVFLNPIPEQQCPGLSFLGGGRLSFSVTFILSIFYL